MTRLLLLVAAVLAIGGCGEPTLADRLKDGGYTLVFRHALTGPEIATRERLGDCATQRNLTAAGREQAAEIGEQVRRLAVPIGDVRASPLCRTMETADLAFRRATPDKDLVSPGVIGTEADDARRGRAVRALAAEPPDDGRNRVLVTHTGTIRAAFGEETVQEGEALVLGDGAELIGRVRAEDWATLDD